MSREVSSILTELRSRSAELVKTSPEVALGSPETVSKVRAHDLYCDLLRLGSRSVFRELRRAAIIDEGMSKSLAASDISDRILSCRDVPPVAVVDLRPDPDPETALEGVSP